MTIIQLFSPFVAGNFLASDNSFGGYDMFSTLGSSFLSATHFFLNAKIILWLLRIVSGVLSDFFNAHAGPMIFEGHLVNLVLLRIYTCHVITTPGE